MERRGREGGREKRRVGSNEGLREGRNKRGKDGGGVPYRVEGDRST